MEAHIRLAALLAARLDMPRGVDGIRQWVREWDYAICYIVYDALVGTSSESNPGSLPALSRYLNVPLPVASSAMNRRVPPLQVPPNTHPLAFRGDLSEATIRQW